MGWGDVIACTEDVHGTWVKGLVTWVKRGSSVGKRVSDVIVAWVKRVSDVIVEWIKRVSDVIVEWVKGLVTS